MKLGGIAYGMRIEGRRNIEWTFRTANGTSLTIKTLCYYIPDYKTRFLSSQNLFNKNKGIQGKYVVEEDILTLKFEVVSPVVIDYDSRNWLPTTTARNLQFNPSINLCITNDEN